MKLVENASAMLGIDIYPPTGITIDSVKHCFVPNTRLQKSYIPDLTSKTGFKTIHGLQEAQSLTLSVTFTENG